MKKALKPRGRPVSSTVLKGAGSLALIGGRLVPTIAAASVVSGYIDFDTSPGEPTLKSGALKGDVKALDRKIAGDVMAGVTAVSYGVALGKGILGGLL
jgi:hypothetical protein